MNGRNLIKELRGRYTSVASYMGKHKKITGEAYPLQRFGAGDLLESPTGVQGVVTARRGAVKESDIMWPSHTSNVRWNNDVLYVYKGEKK